MGTKVINQSSGIFSFPQPYRGVLAPGAGAILTDDINTVIANLGGAQNVRQALRLETTFETSTFHDTNPDAGVNAQAAATATAQTATALEAKYTLAATERVHMEADAPFTTVLAGGALLAVAGAQYLALRLAMLAHFADAGASPTADAAHKVADAANGPGMGTTVTTLGNLITRIGEMKAAIIGHGNQAGVHFHDDTGAGGTGFTLSVDPPVTQADCNADLESCRTAFNVHVGLASL